jgi:membrane protease YdiL (CAAX protease family)
MMHRIKNWIVRHQITAFFAITFAITWGLGFSYGAVMRRQQFLLAPLLLVATCGPALAGISVSAIINTGPRQGKRRAFWLAFAIGWVASLLVMLANNKFINHSPISPIVLGFTVISVLPVAFVIGMTCSRIPAVRSYLSSLIRLRGNYGWALLALVAIPGLIAASIAVSRLSGRPASSGFQLPATGLTLVGLIAVKFLYQMFFFNATGEEVGWRGFALPRLQVLTSPMIAALVIALFWVPWHLFLWQAEGRPVSSGRFWGEYYLIHIFFSLIIVWFYNRSRGSILVAGIAHAAANTAFAFMPRIDLPVFLATVAVAALALVLYDKMWQGLPLDHPAVSRWLATAADPPRSLPSTASL